MEDSTLHKRYLDLLYHYFLKFMDMTREEFDLITPAFEVRKFDKKTKVVSLDEVEKYFNIIMKGLVRKYIVVKKQEITTQLSIEGQMIHSEISFNLQRPSESIVETIEPTVFLSISFENINRIYEQYPRTERLGRMIITEMFIKKDHRDYEKLNKTTRERFLDYMNNHPDMLQRIPQKYLASYLNIKPETFSRLKHLMRPKRNASSQV